MRPSSTTYISMNQDQDDACLAETELQGSESNDDAGILVTVMISPASTTRKVLLIDFRKLSLLLILAVTIYNEHLSYYCASRSWPPPPPATSGDVRIMLVADPQLLGDRDEPIWPLGAITRLDCDRYLSKTFSLAMAYAERVDAIVFLGDLLDEGSTTPDDAIYESYVKRFYNIYSLPMSTKPVFVSGDNDIGGEAYDDPLTPEKIARFRSHFPVRKVTAVNDAFDIVTYNVMTSTYDKKKEVVNEKEPGKVRLLAAHLPVLAPPMSKSTKDMLKKYNPDIVFSAHFHHGFDSLTTRETGMRIFNRTRFLREDDESTVEIDIAENRQEGVIHEIMVPTCSYRMGEPEMAIGLATLTMNNDQPKLIYTNLWLPKRFYSLYLYFVTASLIVVLLLYGRFRSTPSKRGSRQRKGSKTG